MTPVRNLCTVFCIKLLRSGFGKSVWGNNGRLGKIQYRAASGLYCSLNVMGWEGYVARVWEGGGRRETHVELWLGNLTETDQW